MKFNGIYRQEPIEEKWYLAIERNGDSVCFRAVDELGGHIGAGTLFKLTNNKLYRSEGINNDLGLSLDRDNRIMLEGEQDGV